MRKDHFDVLRQLEKHHALFGQFWTVGDIVETKAIPTAAITFDKEGRGIQFIINPDFWDQLTDYDKAFVISHECLHVYFDHGRRMMDLDRKIGNIAGDVVINHYLEDAFGFEREKITNHNMYCWRDTVFPGRKDVQPNRSLEYYYDLLAEQGGAGEQGEGGEGGGPQTVDDHSGWADMDPETAKEILDAMQDVVDRVTDNMSPEEIEDFEDKIGNGEEIQKAQQAGNAAGMITKKIRLGHVIKKRKWETVVQKVIGRFMTLTEDVEIEQWARMARRLSMMGSELMLPSMMEDSVPKRDRIDVWFFQDTSGSCVDYAKRFFKAAASIPEDRFKVRGFCFDTRTYEVDFKKGELQGFGGTYFHIIEDEIQRRVREEKCLYPQAVFIITDGYGSNVHPEFPERWYWFMTDYHSTSNIPKKSNVYLLKDYE